MADKRCDNGHFIDESWDLCPYCPQDASEPEIPVVRPRAAEGAAPPVAAASPRAASQAVHAAAEAPAVAHSPRTPPSDPPSAPPQNPMDRTVAASKLELATQKRYVVGWLVGISGPVRGESFALRMGRNVIGRDKRSDVVINDEQASSHHADLVFRPEEKRFILMDHNSTNGTYVNETEIEPRRDLATNDVIRIGVHRLLFVPLCHEGFYWDDEGLLQ